jgi:enoyl-[acyl-carrier protein] reductase II
MKKNNLTQLLHLDFPLIQAGMVWVSGAKLAAACAKEKILGTIGAGSMSPDLLKQHLQKAYTLCNQEDRRRIAVNFPLLYSGVKEQIDVALKEGVEVFIMSAGSPKLYTQYLKDKNKIVIHVTSSAELAIKCELAGVDAVIVEGFEAGGHNGRDEITSLVLIPQVAKAVKIPVIAAGGFYDAKTIIAGQVLGASAVQMGTRFMMTQESSAHDQYKNLLLKSKSSDTFLRLKKHVPVRLLNNKFSQEIAELEMQGAKLEELVSHLGKGRAKKGMLEGDLEQGELEVGQVVGTIQDLPSCSELIQTIKKDYDLSLKNLFNQSHFN